VPNKWSFQIPCNVSMYNKWMSFVSEHDDNASDNIWNVSFKPGSNHTGRHRNRDLDMAIHAYIDDDDMNTPGSSGRSPGRL